MKRIAVCGFLAVFPLTLLAAPTHRYIVTTTHPYDVAERALPREDFEGRPRLNLNVRSFKVINGFAADLTDDQVVRLLNSGEVNDIEPVVERHVLADSVTAGQQTTPFGVSMVNAPSVWPVTKGAAINGTGPIHVAIIDTGIDYNSPELRRAYKGGHNFISNNEDPLDDFGHGSHVAGIIAAADDRSGVVGVAPDVDIYSLKVLNQCGNGDTGGVIAAIDWILTKKQQIGGNWIANLSLGSSDSSNVERNAFQRGADAGIIFFAASGNSYSGTDGLSFPAGYPSVVSVGAIDVNQLVADFSQRGPQLKVVAPGVNVLSTVVLASVKTNDGRAFPGTTPLVVKNVDTGEPLDGYCLPPPGISGAYVYCGRGNPADFPSSVQGKIALIERGDLTFLVKVQNAKNAGATGVIVFNNKDEALLISVFGPFTTISSVPTFLPYVFISQADGMALKNSVSSQVSLGFGFETWALESGTSMATPHAAAVAALAWAVAPTKSASDVTNAVINSAKDLGDTGVDNTYGHGLVNALEAARLLNPGAFGSGATPTPTPVSGRNPGRRGH
ncbi:MAG: S8 family serine peptidase [Acidobacteriota bacterium]|nr:S8 family serine peptidase [Acidobacteriota bacterium]